MSAVLRLPALHRRTMTLADVDAVLAVEGAAYAFPWTRGNFVDSLIAGYPADVLHDDQATLVAYMVALQGVDEMHLLNLTVAPAWQRQGHGWRMLDALVERCRNVAAERLWLEVRTSNEGAQALYRRYGFEQVGLRRGYYPAPEGRREDAVVMQLKIGPADAVD